MVMGHTEDGIEEDTLIHAFQTSEGPRSPFELLSEQGWGVLRYSCIRELIAICIIIHKLAND